MAQRAIGARAPRLDRFHNFGARPMKFHTRLIGAFDAVILAAAALVTVGFAAELIDPHADRDASELIADATHHTTQPS
jgi:hypothetical protein